MNTIESLPRTPAEAGIIPIIPVKLKRKLEYKSTHLVQLIDTNKIYKYLDFLCKSGHPSYKFYEWFRFNHIRLFFILPKEKIIPPRFLIGYLMMWENRVRKFHCKFIYIHFQWNYQKFATYVLYFIVNKYSYLHDLFRITIC